MSRPLQRRRLEWWLVIISIWMCFDQLQPAYHQLRRSTSLDSSTINHHHLSSTIHSSLIGLQLLLPVEATPLYQTANWWTDFSTAPTTYAGWQAAPSQVGGTGVATTNGSDGSYIDLNLVAETHSGQGVFPNTLNGGTTMTIAVWVKPYSEGIYGRIIDCSDGTGIWPTQNCFVIYRYGGADGLCYTITTTATYATPVYNCVNSGVLTWGIWQLISLVIDTGNVATLYVNGANILSTTVYWPNNVARPYCYQSRSNNYPSDDGLHAEWSYTGYWTRALTAAEQTTLYANPPSNIGSAPFTITGIPVNYFVFNSQTFDLLIAPSVLFSNVTSTTLTISITGDGSILLGSTMTWTASYAPQTLRIQSNAVFNSMNISFVRTGDTHLITPSTMTFINPGSTELLEAAVLAMDFHIDTVDAARYQLNTCASTSRPVVRVGFTDGTTGRTEFNLLNSTTVSEIVQFSTQSQPYYPYQLNFTTQSPTFVTGGSMSFGGWMSCSSWQTSSRIFECSYSDLAGGAIVDGVTLGFLSHSTVLIAQSWANSQLMCSCQIGLAQFQYINAHPTGSGQPLNQQLFQNNPFQVTVTFNQTTMKMYLNGQLASTCPCLTTYTWTNRFNFCKLSKSTQTNDTVFRGQFNSFGIWNRTLVAQEVSVLYTQPPDSIAQLPLITAVTPSIGNFGDNTYVVLTSNSTMLCTNSTPRVWISTSPTGMSDNSKTCTPAVWLSLTSIGCWLPGGHVPLNTPIYFALELSGIPNFANTSVTFTALGDPYQLISNAAPYNFSSNVTGTTFNTASQWSTFFMLPSSHAGWQIVSSQDAVACLAVFGPSANNYYYGYDSPISMFGQSTYIDLTNSSDIFPAPDFPQAVTSSRGFAYAMWMNLFSITGTNTTFYSCASGTASYGPGNIGNLISINQYLATTKLEFKWNAGDGSPMCSVVTTSNVLVLNQPFHVAVSMDASMIGRIWIDGTLSGITNCLNRPGTVNRTLCHLGNSVTGLGESSMDGSMASFSVWYRNISDQEVSALADKKNIPPSYNTFDTTIYRTADLLFSSYFDQTVLHATSVIPGASGTASTGNVKFPFGSYLDLMNTADSGISSSAVSLFDNAQRVTPTIRSLSSTIMGGGGGRGWSIAMWIQYSSYTRSDVTLFEASNTPLGSQKDLIILRQLGSSSTFYFGYSYQPGVTSPSLCSCNSTTTYMDNIGWHHIAAGINPYGIMTIYVDSHLVCMTTASTASCSVSNPLPAISRNTALISASDVAQPFTDGTIASFQMFNRSLTQLEVQSLAFNPPSNIAPAHLVVQNQPPSLFAWTDYFTMNISMILSLPTTFTLKFTLDPATIADGGNVSVSSLVWLYDKTSPITQGFSIHMPQAPSNFICYFTIAGDDAHFSPPPTITIINNYYPIAWSNLPPIGAYGYELYSGQIWPFSIVVTTKPPLGLTATLSSIGIGVFSPSSATLTTGTNPYANFTYTVPIVASWELVTWSVNRTGGNMRHYYAPPIDITIRTTATWTMVVPSAPEIYINETFTIQMTPSEQANYTGVGIGLYINNKFYQNQNLPPNTLSPITFTVLAPPTPQTLNISYRVNGSDYWHFSPPANHSIVILPVEHFNITGIPLTVNMSSTTSSLPTTVPPTVSQLSQFVFQIVPAHAPTGSAVIGYSLSTSSTDGYLNTTTMWWNDIGGGSNWTTPIYILYTAPTTIQYEIITFTLVGPYDVQAEYLPMVFNRTISVQGLVLISNAPQLGPTLGLWNAQPGNTTINIFGTSLLASFRMNVNVTGYWYYNDALASGPLFTQSITFSSSTTPQVLSFINPSTFTLPAAALANVPPGPASSNITLGLIWNITGPDSARFVVPTRTLIQSYIPYGLSLPFPAFTYSTQPIPFDVTVLTPILSGLTITFTNSSGQIFPSSVNLLPINAYSNFTYYSPYLPFGGSWRPVNISLALSGADQYRYQLIGNAYQGDPIHTTVMPQAILNVTYTPWLPSYIYVNESFLLSLQPSATANFTGINVTMYIQGVRQTTLHLIPNSLAPLVFPILAPTTSQLLNISFNMTTLDSSDFWHFVIPSPLTIPVRDRVPFTVLNLPTIFNVSTDVVWTIYPNDIPTGTGWIGLFFDVTQGTLSRTYVEWNRLNWTTPFNITYTSPATTTFVTFQWYYNGPPDVIAEYILPLPVVMNVQIKWSLTNFPYGGLYPHQPSDDIALLPIGLSNLNVSVFVSTLWLFNGSFSASLPGINFTLPFVAASTQLMHFVYSPLLPPPLTYGSNLTFGVLQLFVNFTLSGPDTYRTNQPLPQLIPYIWPAAIQLLNAPTALYSTEPVAMTLQLGFPVQSFFAFRMDFTVGQLISFPTGLVNITGGGGFGSISQTLLAYYFAPTTFTALPTTTFTLSFLALGSPQGEYWRFWIPQTTFSYSVRPQSIFTVVLPSVPTYTGEVFSVSLLPSESTGKSGVFVSILTFEPLNNTFLTRSTVNFQPLAGTSPIVFTLTAPATPQLLEIRFNHSGSDYYHYSVAPTTNLTILPQANLTVSFSYPVIYLNQTFNVLVTPTEMANFTGIDVAIYLNHQFIQTISLPPNNLSSLIFGPFTAPVIASPMLFTFTTSGSDVAHFRLPANTTLNAVQRTHFNITGVPTAIPFNSQQNGFSFVPAIQPGGTSGSIALLLSVNGGAVCQPNYLFWTASNWTKHLNVTVLAPAYAQMIQITYTLVGGYDTVSQFSPAPAPTSINIVGRVVFVNAPIIGSPLAGLYTSQPSSTTVIQIVGVSTAIIPSISFTLLVNATWSINDGRKSGSLFTASFLYLFSVPDQSFSFTVPPISTLPPDVRALYPPGPSNLINLQLSFSFTGFHSSLMLVPDPLFIPVWLQYPITMPLPTTAYTGQTLALTLTPTTPILGELDGTLSVTSGVIQPTTVTWLPQTPPPPIRGTFVTPVIPLFGQPILVIFNSVFTNSDQYRFVITAPTYPVSVLVLPQANFTISYPPVLYANQLWTMTLQPSSYANLTGLNISMLIDNQTVQTRWMQPSIMNPIVFSILAPPIPHLANITFIFNGSDAAHFEVPQLFTINFLPPSPFIIVGMPSVIQSSKTVNPITFRPATYPNNTGVTLSMTVWLSGTSTPSIASSLAFSFSPFVTDTWSFSLTAPHVTSDQILTLNFTLTGSDVPHFIKPTSIVILVQYPKAYFNVTGMPLIAYSYLPITINVRMIQPEYLGTPVILSLVNLLDPTQPPVQQLTFSFSSSQAFTVTLPVFTKPANITQLGWTVSDPVHFIAPPTLTPWYPYPVGYYGPQVLPCQCAVHGTCADGPTGTGFCTCAPAWNGTRCDDCATNFYSPTCIPCQACSSFSRCDSGVLGTGACVCNTGFTGVGCADCLPYYFGNNCQACPDCVRGSCDDGRTGTGCVCEVGWQGSTCASPIPGALVSYYASVSGYDGEFVLITLNASVTSFVGKISELPTIGTLFQTDDGSTPGAEITSATTVTSRLNQVLYLLPSSYDPDRGSGELTSFSWYATTVQAGSSSEAVLSIFALHNNQPPTLSGKAVDSLAVGGTLSLIVPENSYISLVGLFQLKDVDSGFLPINVALSSTNGYFLFDPFVLNGTLYNNRTNVTSSSPFISTAIFSVSPSYSVVTSFNFTSSQYNLNILLNYLYYAPAPYVYGSDAITVVLNDLGNAGTDGSGPKTSTYAKIVDVWINEINQPISLVPGGPTSSRPDLLSLTAPFIVYQNIPKRSLRLQIFDIDSYFGTDLLELEVCNGTISFEGITNPRSNILFNQIPPTFLNGTGRGGDDHILVLAPLDTLNALLSNFTYTPARDFVGTDTLVIRANDNGNTGLGNVTEVIRSIPIIVQFSDIPPIAHDLQVFIYEDSREVVTLFGEDTSKFISSATTFAYQIVSLPNPNVTFLHQYNAPLASAPLVERPPGAMIKSTPTTVLDSHGQVLIRLALDVYGQNLTSFKYTVTKQPAGLTSIVPGIVSITVLHVNHPPFVENALDSTGVKSPVASNNYHFFQSAYFNTDLVVVLNATDVDDMDTLKFYIMSLPARGQLWQYDDSATTTSSSSSIVPGAPILSPYRGAPITLNGTAVTSATRAVIYTPIFNDNWNGTSSTQVYTSFRYTADDSHSQIAPYPQIDLYLQSATYPIASNFSSTTPQDADASVIFFIAPSQSAILALSSVTILTLPPQGSLFVRKSDGSRGTLISSVPFIVALPSSPLAAINTTAVTSVLSVIFAPTSGLVGQNVTSFQYSLTTAQGSLSSPAPGYIWFTFIRMNQAPTATSSSYVSIFAKISVTLNIADPDVGQTLTGRILTLPTAGRLQQMDGTWIVSAPAIIPSTNGAVQLYYEPVLSPHTPYYTSFSFVGSDGSLLSTSQTVSFIAYSSTIAPISQPLNVYIQETDWQVVNLLAADPKGGAVVALITSFPTYVYLYQIDGVTPITITNNRVMPDVSGKHNIVLVAVNSIGAASVADGFSYCGQEIGGTLTTGTQASVTLTVAHKRIAPVPWESPLLIRTPENVPILIPLNGTSIESSTISAYINSLPTVGSLFTYDCRSHSQDTLITTVPILLNPCSGDQFASVWYVPPSYQFGSGDGYLTSFSMTLFDGVLAAKQPTTVKLYVPIVDYLPLTNSTTYTLPQNAPLIVSLSCLDLNGAPLSKMFVEIDFFPQTGLLYQFDSTVDDGSNIGQEIELSIETVSDPLKRIFYIPNFGATGTDTFTYSCHLPATDGSGTILGSLPGTITLKLSTDFTPPYLPPPTLLNWNITENAMGVMQLQFIDLDHSDAIELHITSLPTRGQLYQIRTDFVLNTNVTSNPNAIEFGPSSWRRGEHLDSAAGEFDYRHYHARTEAVLDLTSQATANPVASVSPVGRYAAVPSATALTFPALRTQTIWSSSNTLPRFDNSPLAAPITTVGVYVTHPQFLIGFLPGDRVAGNPKREDFYAGFTYSALNLRSGLKSANDASVQIHVPSVFLPPRAVSFEVSGVENTPFMIYFQGIASDGSSNVLAQIASSPKHGIICQTTPPAGFVGSYPSYCGEGYGALAVPGLTVTDPLVRVIYKPNLNVFGPVGFDQFSYRVVNIDRTPAYLPPSVGTSIPGNVSIAIQFVNQPPQTNSSLVKYLVPWQIGKLTLDLYAEDPDDSLDSLTFVITGMRGHGLFRFNRTFLSQDGSLQWTMDQFNLNSTFPFTMPPATRRLYFDANGEGNIYPYTSFTYTVIDSVLNRRSDEVQLSTDCGNLLYPNVWSPGELCMDCPLGATCSSVGDYLPISQKGYWHSDRTVNDQPIYILCQPEEACGGNIDFNSTDQCALGFTGRLCGDCSERYYRSDGSCSICSSGASIGMQFVMYILPISVIVVLIFLLIIYLQLETTFFAILFAFFQLVSTFKKFNLGWLNDTQSVFSSLSVLLFNIELLQLRCNIGTLTYIQEWGIFMLLPWAVLLLLFIMLHSFAVLWSIFEWKKSLLHPPPASLQTRYRQSMRNLNALSKDLNSQTTLTKKGKRGSMVEMSSANDLLQKKGTLAKLKAEGEESSGSSRSSRSNSSSQNDSDLAIKAITINHTDMDVNDPAHFLSPALVATLAPIATPPKHPGADATLSQQRKFKLKYQNYLNELALALDIETTGEIIDGEPAATLADIQAARFYAPPAHVHGYWQILKQRLFWSHTMILHAWMTFLNFAYLSLSIRAMEPLKCTSMPDGSRVLDAVPALSCDDPWWYQWAPVALFASIFYSGVLLLFFAWIMFHERPPYDSVTCCRFFFYPVQLLGQKVKDQIWRSGFAQQKRDSVIAGYEQYKLTQSVTNWSLRYRSMTSPFRTHYYFWTIVLKLISLLISLDAVWIASYPIYQALFAIFILGGATILQFRNLPFRLGTGMNELSMITNWCALAIIFLGLLFNASKDEVSPKYPFMREFLNRLLQLFMAICILATIVLLRRQLGINFPDTCTTSSERKKLSEEAKAIRERNALAVHEATVEKEVISSKFPAPMTVPTKQFIINDVQARDWLASLHHLYSLPAQRKYLYAGGRSSDIVGGHGREVLEVNQRGEVIEEDTAEEEHSTTEASPYDLEIHSPRLKSVQPTEPSRSTTPIKDLNDLTDGETAFLASVEGVGEPSSSAPGLDDDARPLDQLPIGIRETVRKARLAAAKKYAQLKEQPDQSAVEPKKATEPAQTPRVVPAIPIRPSLTRPPTGLLVVSPETHGLKDNPEWMAAKFAQIKPKPISEPKRRLRKAVRGVAAAAAFAHALLVDNALRSGEGEGEELEELDDDALAERAAAEMRAALNEDEPESNQPQPEPAHEVTMEVNDSKEKVAEVDDVEVANQTISFDSESDSDEMDEEDAGLAEMRAAMMEESSAIQPSPAVSSSTHPSLYQTNQLLSPRETPIRPSSGVDVGSVHLHLANEPWSPLASPSKVGPIASSSPASASFAPLQSPSITSPLYRSSSISGTVISSAPSPLSLGPTNATSLPPPLTSRLSTTRQPSTPNRRFDFTVAGRLNSSRALSLLQQSTTTDTAATPTPAGSITSRPSASQLVSDVGTPRLSGTTGPITSSTSTGSPIVPTAIPPPATASTSLLSPRRVAPSNDLDQSIATLDGFESPRRAPSALAARFLASRRTPSSSNQ